MADINFIYTNIALNAFAFVVVLIVFFSCISERIGKKKGSIDFLILLSFVLFALAADIVAWIGEGRPALRYMTLIANTLASCAAQFVIVCFMTYLKNSLHATSRAASHALRTFRGLCLGSVAFTLGNAVFGYAFFVNEQGHYVRNTDLKMSFLYLLFPMLSFIAIIMMSLFAKRSAGTIRMAFIIYTIFPMAGIILDYSVHGFSLTYVGLSVSALTIYTVIYLQKQKLIESQKQTLMLSQINPHFVHNTLTTIASMCDISPRMAKNLTIDFSRYLRQNLNSLTCEELISFDKELEHVECYLKIEKVRFREKLNVIYAIECKDFRIPPLSVQPIVENAVKHGITKKAQGGTLRISTYSTDTHYVIEVKDDGVGFDTEMLDHGDKTHIGLENVQNRIADLCRGNLSVKSTVGVGTRVTIEIPKKRGTGR